MKFILMLVVCAVVPYTTIRLTVAPFIQGRITTIMEKGEKRSTVISSEIIDYIVSDELFGGSIVPCGAAIKGRIIINTPMEEGGFRDACLAHEYCHVLDNIKPKLWDMPLRFFGIEPWYETRADSMAVRLTSYYETVAMIRAVTGKYPVERRLERLPR